MIDPRESVRASEILKGSRALMVLGHQYPDGDAIGSVLGTSLLLAKAGHDVQASWPEPFQPPAKYDFLPGGELLVRPKDLSPGGAAVVLDCANPGRLDALEAVAMAATGLINIDHHPDNTLFGEANLVDCESSATAQIILDVALDLGLELDLDVAKCLYTAIVTDTGRFQYSNTGEGTLAAAARLVGMGVEPNRIFEQVYQSDSLHYMRFSGAVLTRAEYDEPLGLIYAAVTRQDLRSFGVAMNETEDLVDNLRALKGHRVAALFKELPDGAVRVSLRSRADTDIGSVARKLGGGGHRVAAGYTSGRGSVQEALDELKGELGGQGAGTR